MSARRSYKNGMNHKGTTGMRIRTIIAALAATAALAGCHGKASNDKKEAQAPAENGMPISKFQDLAKQRGGKPEVMRMMAVSGRWESQPGAVAGIGNRHLTLTISNDNKFSLDLMGRDAKATMDTVDIDVRGGISWDQAGILSGSGKGAKPPLKGFDSWKASFPKPGQMHITGTDGKGYDLSYRGA